LGIGVDFDFEAQVFGDMHGKHGAAACPVNVEHCYSSTSCGIIGRTKNTPLKYLNAILVCSFAQNFPKPFHNFGLWGPAGGNTSSSLGLLLKNRKKRAKDVSPAAKTLPDVDDLSSMQRRASCATCLNESKNLTRDYREFTPANTS
jgi:hypothetical protein